VQGKLRRRDLASHTSGTAQPVNCFGIAQVTTVFVSQLCWCYAKNLFPVQREWKVGWFASILTHKLGYPFSSFYSVLSTLFYFGTGSWCCLDCLQTHSPSTSASLGGMIAFPPCLAVCFSLHGAPIVYVSWLFILSQIGKTYNIPIRFWILDSHPFAPPICFLKPTANMEISVGKHVDAKGRIYLPYLQNWSHVRSIWIFFYSSEYLSLILVTQVNILHLPSPHPPPAYTTYVHTHTHTHTHTYMH
jgi:hypothetical protein